MNHSCKASAVLWVPLLVGGMALFLTSLRQCGRAASEHGVYTYWHEDLVAILDRNGVDMDSALRVQRTWDSTGLLVSGHRAGVPTCVLLQAGQVPRSWTIPTTTCWMDQHNEPVAWLGQIKDQVVLATGEQIPVAQRVFDADPSGSYFVLGGEGRFTWLGRVRDPHVRHLVSADTFGLSVFVASDRIYVGGTPYGKDPIRSSPGTRCLVFKDTEDGFVLLERHDFPSAHAVLDVAQDGEKLLLMAGGDLYSRLVVYDMKSRKQTRVGAAKALSFLLVSDPAAPPVDDELDPASNK